MNSSFSTHASNFSTGLHSTVDNRTGLYSMNLQLLSVTANNNLGPSVALSLSYNPLDSLNLGYGIGFSLGLSSYDVTTGMLTLSSGEKYRVTETATQLIVLQKKLNNFIFRKKNNVYQIIWKNGTVEELQGRASIAAIKFPVRIISPLGHEVNFEWDYSAPVPRLKRVKDNFRTLLTIQYNSNLSTVIDVFPTSSENKRLNLLFANNNLSKLTLVTSDNVNLNWSLTYQKIGSWYWANGLTYPTGLKEQASYQNNLMRFPDKARLAALPAVVKFEQSPGAGQPNIATHYAYSDANYLGYGGNNDWDTKNDFNYGIAGHYEYSSTETVVSAQKTIVIQRRYNKFHLLKQEQTERDGVSMTRTLSYYANEIGSFDKQPPQFLLPKEVTEEVKNVTGGTRVRRTTTRFDEAGNLLEQIDPDGTLTSFIWYPAQGEGALCPSEPQGFIRFMKQKTVHYPQNRYTDVADISEHYTYQTLGNSRAVVQQSESILEGSTLLRRKVTRYRDNKGDPEFGRIIEMQETTYASSDRQTEFVSSLQFTTEVEGTNLKQKVHFTGHDGLSSYTQRTTSLLSGLVQDETDSQGVKTVYQWDGCGRLLSRTRASGTRYENTTTWSYRIEGSPITVQTDKTGLELTTMFDGMARVISQASSDIDYDKKNYTVYSARYNEVGERVSEIVNDWTTLSAGTPRKYRQEQKTQFGAWGEAELQTTSDGLMHRQTVDPVNLTQTLQTQGGQYATASRTGITTHLFDETDLRPKRVEFRDASNREHASVSYSWDGKGQLREFTDERGNRTRYTYDAYGRVVTQTLPDGTVVTRTYAPFLTGDKVTSIQVQESDANGRVSSWVLGTQTFDSLGRLQQLVSGGRVTRYEYEGAAPLPATIVLPSGRRIAYTYIPELGNVVSRVRVDGIEQTFSYDDTTGELLQGTENGIKIEHIWSKAGNLKQEKISLGQGARQTNYTHLLSGSVASYTDITGQETRYERDEYGRVILINDSALSVVLEYDGLGRVSVQTVQDKANLNHRVSTTLQYDDFNRETARTIQEHGGLSITVKQTWQENNLLSSRTTYQNGGMLKEEHYNYDTRNRLVLYTVRGHALPKDGYGQSFVGQHYAYDALNNLVRVITTLADNGQDVAQYDYTNNADPTQLTSVTHSHANYPASIALRYDAEGRLIEDEAGRVLDYDALGRLQQVKVPNGEQGRYHYDAFNHLVKQEVGNTDHRELFYRGEELINEVLTTQKREMRFIKSQHTCLAVDDGRDLILTATDNNDSVLWSRAGTENEGKTQSWGPYGSGTGRDTVPGFNGERRDPLSGAYHLGNGYRAYNPTLMRFTCPDSLSPFGAGGINSYAYCAGDPINFTDPSGHLSWQGILGIVMGVVGLALSAVTAGASIAAAGGIMAALSSASVSSLVIGAVGVVSDVTAIVSGALEDSHQEASDILGWVSFATGLVGMAAGAFSSRKQLKSIKKIKIDKNQFFALNGDESFSKTFGIRFSLDETNQIHWKATGFSSRFNNTPEPVLIVHGIGRSKRLFYVHDSSVLHNLPEGTIKMRVALHVPEFYEHLKIVHGIDLKTVAPGQPLHLVCCYSGGEEGIARQLAHYLQRPVIGYGNYEKIYTSPYALITEAEQGLMDIYVKRKNLLVLAPTFRYYP